MSEELHISKDGPVREGDIEAVGVALGRASSRGQVTWVVFGGQRIAAIVPVEVAEHHEKMIADILATPVGPRRVQFPQVTVELTGHDGGTGTIIARTSEAMRAAGLDDRTVRNFAEAVLGCGSYNDVLGFLARTVNVK